MLRSLHMPALLVCLLSGLCVRESAGEGVSNPLRGPIA